MPVEETFLSKSISTARCADHSLASQATPESPEPVVGELLSDQLMRTGHLGIPSLRSTAESLCGSVDFRRKRIGFHTIAQSW